MANYKDKEENKVIENSWVIAICTKSRLNPCPAKISGQFITNFSAISVQDEHSCIHACVKQQDPHKYKNKLYTNTHDKLEKSTS